MRYTPKGAIRVSPSELKCADTCLRKYYYQYIKDLKIPKAYNFGFALGVSMHHALDDYLKAKKANLQIDDTGLFKQHWENMQKEAGEFWLKDADLEGIPLPCIMSRANQLFKSIKQFVEPMELLGVEEHLTAPLDKFHELHGYVDVRYKPPEDVVTIGDWKFGKQAKSAGDVLEFWYQFTGYRFMCEQMHGVTPKLIMHTGAISLAGNPKQEFKFLQFPADLPFDTMYKDLHIRVRALTEHVMRAGDDIESCREKYPKTGRSNGVCSYCEFCDICDGKMAEPDSAKSKPIEAINEQTSRNQAVEERPVQS